MGGRTTTHSEFRGLGVWLLHMANHGKAPAGDRANHIVAPLVLLPLLLQKLAFIAAEVKLVPLESIAAVEGSIADYTQAQQDKVG